MATGYDNRQGGRSSFAFEPARPSQSQPASGGGFRGIQMQGGTTSIAGGVAAASQVTQAGPDASQLGGFLTGLLAPAIERRKQEQFVKGMVDQMSAVAGEEIRANPRNPINTIFGPTSYEEGAIFFAARDATNQWQQKMLADVDNLKRLPPEELTKVIAASFEEMTTGDRFTDLAVTTSLIEASPAVVGAISKERYKWQQSTALANWSAAADSGGSAFQQQAVTLASSGEASDAGNLAMNAAHNNFLASLQIPEGMDEETYRRGLIGFYRRAAQSGNGYAVTALKNSGFLDLLTDEELVRLEDAEIRYGNRALGDAAVFYAEEIDELNFDMQFGRVSSTEAMSRLATINEQIKGATGFDLNLFDYNDVVGAGKNVWSSLHTEMKRQESRRWELEDMARRENFQREEREAEAQAEAAQVRVAWASGSVKTAMAQGVGSTGNFDVLAQADFAQGDWSNMIRAYNKDLWVSSLVQSQVQAQIVGSMGQEYNQDFQQGYEKFTALNKAKPAAAMAYYGDMYAPLLNYERLITTGRDSPSIAFGKAFTNLAQYSPIPQEVASARDKIVEWATDNRGRGWIMGTWIGRDGLGSSGMNALTNAMSRQLAVQMKSTDMPIDSLIPGLYQDVVRSGAFEDYGRLGWSNPPGTQNLGEALGLMQDEADEVVQGVIDQRLKAAGFRDGIKGDDFNIMRIRTADGQTAVSVTPFDKEDGQGATVVIPFTEFKQRADTTRAGRASRGQSLRERQVDPARRIPGESSADRIRRINREVAEAGFRREFER